MKQLMQKINVEQLKSCLLQRRTMRQRFRLPMSEEQAYDCLLAATMAEVEFRHRVFCENEDIKSQLSKMAKWLTSNDSKFGILLCGECGNGKSTVLKAFQQLLNLLAIPAADGGGNYGIQITDAKHITFLGKTDYPAFMKITKRDMLGIDDIGTEPVEVMDYGNIVTPVIDLLTKRYDDQLFTIITTNLTPKQIREHYGDRIADRLNEMFEKIVFKNGSYRTVTVPNAGTSE